MTAQKDPIKDPMACVPAVAVAKSRRERAGGERRFTDFFGRDADELSKLPVQARVAALARMAEDWDAYASAQVEHAPRNAYGEVVIEPESEWKAVTLPYEQAAGIRAAAGKPAAYAAVAWRTEYRGWILVCSPKDGLASGRIMAVARVVDCSPVTPDMAKALGVRLGSQWIVWTFRDILAVETTAIRGSTGVWHHVVPS